MLSLLCVSLIFPLIAAWSFTDDWGQTFSGSSWKPRIVCHPDACDSLFGMGVGMDQLVGYFDKVTKVRPCHGALCHDTHFELMQSVMDEGDRLVDVAKLKKLNPDLIVDYSYSTGAGYSGLLRTFLAYKDLQPLNIPLIEFQVAHKPFIKVVETIQRFVTAISSSLNLIKVVDTIRHCHDMHKAMSETIKIGKSMGKAGVRVLAAAFRKEAFFLAQPTHHPILLMLEQLGVPMIHVNTSNEDHFWGEVVDFPKSNGTTETNGNTQYNRNAANILRVGGHAMYPVDVWLYDAHPERSNGEPMNIIDPAWDAGQYVIWHFDAPFTYEQGTRILNTMHAVFSKAERVAPKTDCVLADVAKGEPMDPGQWACNPQVMGQDIPTSFLPSCPALPSVDESLPETPWTFEDQGIKYSGTSKFGKLRVMCSPLVCESLWSMGLRSDQLIGYFFSVDDLCHGILCYQFHFEDMRNCQDNEYGVDLIKIMQMRPDIIIDTAYKRNATELKGLLELSPQFDKLDRKLTELGIPLIKIQVDNRDYMDVVNSMRSLAVALGGPPKHNDDQHCYALNSALDWMSSMGDHLKEKGIRVVAASISETHIYAAQPTSDPILIMLESLGVPMLHVNAQLWEHDGGGYWEPMKFPQDGTNGTNGTNGKVRNTVDIARLDGGAMYPVDVWLYDARGKNMGTRYYEEKLNISDPAWDAGQYTIWPVDGPFTYEQAARILNTLRRVFAKAKRLHPKTNCTVADVSSRERLPGGSWICRDYEASQSYLAGASPTIGSPSCPVTTTPAPLTENPQDNLQTALVADHAEARSPISMLLASMVTVAMLA